MSRSYRRTPIGGITGCNSAKAWRSQENRRYRAYVRDLMRHQKYDSIQGYGGRFGNEWSGPRDGKTHWFDLKNKPCNTKPYFLYGFVCQGCLNGEHRDCHIYYKKLMRK